MVFRSEGEGAGRAFDPVTPACLKTGWESSIAAAVCPFRACIAAGAAVLVADQRNAVSVTANVQQASIWIAVTVCRAPPFRVGLAAVRQPVAGQCHGGGDRR